VVRRKSKSFLHRVENDSVHELSPAQESLTSELFRKGLSKKRVRKTGVVDLREKIQVKKDRRESRAETTRERQVRLAAEYAAYAAGIVAFERDPDSAEAQKLVRDINTAARCPDRRRPYVKNAEGIHTKRRQFIQSAE
jgi:hypothetical protein